jgi:hypothetical protein
MVSCWPAFQEFVTGTNTPCAAPLEPQVALPVTKVMESAKTMVMVMERVAVPLTPVYVLPVTVRVLVPAVRPLKVAVNVPGEPGV